MRVVYISGGGGGTPPGATLFSALLRIALGALALAAPDFTVELVVSYVAVLVLVLAFISGLIAGFQLRSQLPALGAIIGTVVLGAIGLAALAWPRSAAMIVLGLLAVVLVLNGAGQMAQAMSIGRGALAVRLLITGVAASALAALIILRPDQALDALVLVIGALALASGLLALLRTITGRRS